MLVFVLIPDAQRTELELGKAANDALACTLLVALATLLHREVDDQCDKENQEKSDFKCTKEKEHGHENPLPSSIVVSASLSILREVQDGTIDLP